MTVMTTAYIESRIANAKARLAETEASRPHALLVGLRSTLLEFQRKNLSEWEWLLAHERGKDVAV